MSGSAPHPAASTPGHNNDGGVVEQEPHHWNLTAGEEIRFAISCATK